ncbi:hypothetical protein [Planctomycetes bacterium K23_9]|uniref:Uncharacterized protein n=1 Tax=Stieleria marina TaxID=1930275 RepID=A0A517NW32_9BACT|nr:hypothetical protein K239x_33350 [Planctomycetes bacterium K23_9]
MSMKTIADEIIQVCGASRRTPVLLVPANLKLRPAFFVAIASELLTRHEVGQVRFDWLVDDRMLQNHPAAYARFWNTRRSIRRINRKLQQSLGAATMELSSRLSHPVESSSLEPNPRSSNGTRSRIPLGISTSGSDLPPWSETFTLRI